MKIFIHDNHLPAHSWLHSWALERFRMGALKGHPLFVFTYENLATSLIKAENKPKYRILRSSEWVAEIIGKKKSVTTD